MSAVSLRINRRWSNPPVGEVWFHVEAWPHDREANGEEYMTACLPAADVARDLRRLADRIESDWATPECPWPSEHLAAVSSTSTGDNQ